MKRWFIAAGVILAAGVFVRANTRHRVGCSWGIPRIVYSHDVEPGQRLTFDDISQRTVPEATFRLGISPEAVEPLLGRTLKAPHRAGELARASHVY